MRISEMGEAMTPKTNATNRTIVLNPTDQKVNKLKDVVCCSDPVPDSDSITAIIDSIQNPHGLGHDFGSNHDPDYD